VKYPLRAQLLGILRIDLLEAAEAPARVIPIVGKPIRPRGSAANASEVTWIEVETETLPASCGCAAARNPHITVIQSAP